MKLFTEDHEWVEIEDGIATVGVTDYAVESLGDLVFVELPTLGAKIKVGSQVAVVESVKSASDVFAPLSGEIVEVNEFLLENPDTVNTSPEEDGWLFKIKIENEEEINNLLSAEDYSNTIH